MGVKPKSASRRTDDEFGNAMPPKGPVHKTGIVGYGLRFLLTNIGSSVFFS